HGGRGRRGRGRRRGGRRGRGGGGAGRRGGPTLVVRVTGAGGQGQGGHAGHRCGTAGEGSSHLSTVGGRARPCPLLLDGGLAVGDVHEDVPVLVVADVDLHLPVPGTALLLELCLVEGAVDLGECLLDGFTDGDLRGSQ